MSMIKTYSDVDVMFWSVLCNITMKFNMSVVICSPIKCVTVPSCNVFLCYLAMSQHGIRET